MAFNSSTPDVFEFSSESTIKRHKSSEEPSTSSKSKKKEISIQKNKGKNQEKANTRNNKRNADVIKFSKDWKYSHSTSKKVTFLTKNADAEKDDMQSMPNIQEKVANLSRYTKCRGTFVLRTFVA